jgi:hypothetical protein
VGPGSSALNLRRTEERGLEAIFSLEKMVSKLKAKLDLSTNLFIKSRMLKPSNKRKERGHILDVSPFFLFT